MKILLEYQGITCQSPRNCIKLAFRHGVIEDDEILLDMLEDRNRSSYVYNEQIAEAIFLRIRTIYSQAIRRVLESLRGKV